MPGLDRPAALITLDNGLDHTKPNTFGPGGLASLDAAIDEALRGQPGVHRGHRQAVHLLRRRRPDRHAAAAPTRDQALEIGRLGHRVFAKLRDAAGARRSPSSTARPWAAASSWRCTATTARSPAARRRSRCPRSSLGLVPGWGGTQLLPNLIGIINAAQVIVQNPLMQNKMLRPTQAHEMGIADALFEPADFLERSLEWAAVGRPRRDHRGARAEVDRSRDVGRDPRLRPGRARRAAARRARRRRTGRWICWRWPRTAPFADGTAAEDEALADLVMSDGAAQRALRLRPGAAAGQAPGRRARPGAGPRRSPRSASSAPA